MQLTRSLRLGFVVLLAVHLATAFTAVALLGRMRPAIELIIQDNVRSLEAVEEVLALLADPLADNRDERAQAAFERAARNVTNEDERPAIDLIGINLDKALGGDDEAVAVVASQLRRLAAINRRDLESSDRRAQQLGSAGAWTVVILTLFTLAFGVVARRRLDAQVLGPLEELHEVVDELGEGHALRRCRPNLVAAGELGQIMRAFNRLLDERDEHRAPDPDAKHLDVTADRGVLLALLEDLDGPSAVLTSDGKLIAASRQLMDEIATSDDVMPRLRSAEDGKGARVRPIGDRRIVTLTKDGLATTPKSLKSEG